MQRRNLGRTKLNFRATPWISIALQREFVSSVSYPLSSLLYESFVRLERGAFAYTGALYTVTEQVRCFLFLRPPLAFTPKVPCEKSRPFVDLDADTIRPPAPSAARSEFGALILHYKKITWVELSTAAVHQRRLLCAVG